MKRFVLPVVLMLCTSFASAQILANTHHNSLIGPQPDHASIIATLGLTYGSTFLNSPLTSAKFMISGQITGGMYSPGNLIYQIRICDVRNCSGSVNATVGKVQLDGAATQYPTMYTVEGTLWTDATGTSGVLRSDLTASLYLDGSTPHTGHNQGSATLDLTQNNYYLVLVVEVPSNAIIVGTPVFEENFVRFSYY